MPDFSTRSYEKELLDRDDIPFEEIKRNMQELEIINTRLGGHQITLSGLKNFVGDNDSITSICEIGCGGGDNLKAIARWCNQKKISITLTGIDINKDCIEYARENCRQLPSLKLITSDYQQVNFSTDRPSIIFSSLFSHHLNDKEFCDMLRWSNKNSKTGFFINDLHRHPLAYYSIQWLTRLFSKSRLVKNDAPLSVRRGFTRQELEKLILQAGITQFTIKWKWAFRWLVIIKH